MKWFLEWVFETLLWITVVTVMIMIGLAILIKVIFPYIKWIGG